MKRRLCSAIRRRAAVTGEVREAISVRLVLAMAGVLGLLVAPMAAGPGCGGSDRRQEHVFSSDAGNDGGVIPLDMRPFDWDATGRDAADAVDAPEAGQGGAGGKGGAGGQGGMAGQAGSGGKGGTGGVYPDAGSASGLLKGKLLIDLTAAEREQLCVWTLTNPTVTSTTKCALGSDLPARLGADAGVQTCAAAVPAASSSCMQTVADWESCVSMYSCTNREPQTCVPYCTFY